MAGFAVGGIQRSRHWSRDFCSGLLGRCLRRYYRLGSSSGRGLVRHNWCCRFRASCKKQSGSQYEAVKKGSGLGHAKG